MALQPALLNGSRRRCRACFRIAKSPPVRSPRPGSGGDDYLLLLSAGGEPDLAHYAADRLELVTATDAAALFRVRPAVRDSLPR